MTMRSSGCNIFSVITSRLERSAVIRLRSPREMMLLTFIAVAHPSLTHLLFALCFIERDESVFPMCCPAWQTLLPRRFILQTAPAARLIKRSMWPDGGTDNGTDFTILFLFHRSGWGAAAEWTRCAETNVSAAFDSGASPVSRFVKWCLDKDQHG